MKRKRQALEDGDEEAEISSQGDTAKQEEAAKNQKSRKKEINSTSRPQGSIKTKSQDNNTIGSSKKVREHDPERLWKRDRVCADFTSLQDQAGAGGVSPSKLEAGGKAQELSLDYLRQWKNDREHWKFLKVRQVWLLKHMFHKSKVGKSDFKTLLAYLSGLKGAARATTLKLAQKIVDGEDTEEEKEDEEEVSAQQEATEPGTSAAAISGDGDEDKNTASDDEDDTFAAERIEEERQAREAAKLERANLKAKEKRCRQKRATQLLRELA